MINITLKSIDDYKLTMTKEKCKNPGGLYEVSLIKEFSNKERDFNVYYMTQEELTHFAQALLV